MAISRYTTELKPGMSLDEDIFNRDKVLLLAKGAVLTVENIATIRRLGYIKVSVRKPPGAPAFWNRFDEEKLKEFQKTYAESSEEVVELIKYISGGERMNVDQAYQVPGTILEETHSPYNLFPYLNQVKHLDDRTHGHSINVSLICGAICRWLDLPADTSRDIIVAGLLHDIGMSRISPDILSRSERLSADEAEEMKKHTVYGYRILEEAKAPQTVSTGALSHHEREDGSGYPSGLEGSQIPLAAKVISVADVYDTLTAGQPDRGSTCPFKVIEQLQQDFYGVLDTKILVTFLFRIAECYVGEMVRLSDGRTGQVVVINRMHPSRPMVRTDKGIVDLYTDPGVQIEAILPAGQD